MNEGVGIESGQTFIEGCGDYLIILVLHATFVSHGCLFKIHVIVA